MRSSRSKPWHATFLVAVLFLAGLMSGAWAGATAADRAQGPFADLDLFAQVLTTIESDYVEAVDTSHLVEAALQGMVDELDAHSRWLTAEEVAAFRDETEGSYEGIGVEVRQVPEGVLVAAVLEGGPAERDGMQAGDVIVAVDGHDLAGLPLPDVAALLKGPRGSDVTLTVERAAWAEPRTLQTVRDRIVAPAVSGERLPSGVAYVRLLQFQHDVGEALADEIARLQGEGDLSGLVLDLRDNPGGLLDEAVAVSDLFLDEGLIVSTRGRVDGSEEHHATPGGVATDLPVVVLVNGLSASASEIVAGALQDTGRATLVGTATYGKGSVQVLYENRDRSALRLTIARYYTPSGEPVAPEQGRAPDHVVPLPAPADPAKALEQRITALDLAADERDELLALVARLPEAPDMVPLVPRSGTVPERREKDAQLDYALDLLEE